MVGSWGRIPVQQCQLPYVPRIKPGTKNYWNRMCILQDTKSLCVKGCGQQENTCTRKCKLKEKHKTDVHVAISQRGSLASLLNSTTVQHDKMLSTVGLNAQYEAVHPKEQILMICTSPHVTLKHFNGFLFSLTHRAVNFELSPYGLQGVAKAAR